MELHAKRVRAQLNLFKPVMTSWGRISWAS